jgi:hypothetical protein
MSSELLKNFLGEQAKLMNATAHAKPANKNIVRPEKATATVNLDDPEVMYNYVIEKKPANKKVIKFLQQCIDSIMEDED